MTTASSTADAFIVSLDVGSSSVRALLFDRSARQMEGFGGQLPYKIHTSSGGGAEVDPEQLAQLSLDCLDEVHRQAQEAGFRIAAVAMSAFWHGLMGIGADCRPVTPLLHLFDTRSTPFLGALPDTHSRTGCPKHPSFWPSKLIWLRESQPDVFAQATRWISFPEYLFQKLFGEPVSSTSMTSATGIWDQRANDYDAESLEASGIRRDQLADPISMDQPKCELLPEHQQAWPGFKSATWFPALGDGALNHVGSGCLGPRQFSLMVGTTGAMRASVGEIPQSVPAALWCYRLDRDNALIGGALSSGGEAQAWMKQTLQLPRDLEARLDQVVPGDHGLALLPFFSGERTPYWRGDLRAAIAGLSLETQPTDIYRATLEAVALGFAEIHSLLRTSTGPAEEILASGGALLRSPSWTQMMAEALGTPVTVSTEPEASARGAALWALWKLGCIPDFAALPASRGAVFEPRENHKTAWAELAAKRSNLYRRIYNHES